MLPGLTRTAAQPASIAANTYFGWKWMSAITGICDLLRDRRQRVGVVLARARRPGRSGSPAAVSSAICCSVALTSEVERRASSTARRSARRRRPATDADLDLARLCGAAASDAAGGAAGMPRPTVDVGRVSAMRRRRARRRAGEAVSVSPSWIGLDEVGDRSAARPCTSMDATPRRRRRGSSLATSTGPGSGRPRSRRRPRAWPPRTARRRRGRRPAAAAAAG